MICESRVERREILSRVLTVPARAKNEKSRVSRGPVGKNIHVIAIKIASFNHLILLLISHSHAPHSPQKIQDIQDLSSIFSQDINKIMYRAPSLTSSPSSH